MYQDFYLRFSSEAEANAVLYTVTSAVYELDADGNPTDKVISEEYTTPNYQNIDVLGVLYQKQEIVDPENPPEPTPLDGWHVNVRTIGDEDGAALEPFKVEPKAPRRVWA